MKNLLKFFGIVVFISAIGLSFVSCDDGGGPGGGGLGGAYASLAGTYGYTSTGSLTITFRTDGTFTGTSLFLPVNGTYTISGSVINLSANYYGYTWIIIDSNTVMDGDNDRWRRR